VLNEALLIAALLDKAEEMDFFLRRCIVSLMDASKKTRRSVSAFVVCFNEEAQIRRCLESVKWCDEIVIIDSHSTDNTVALCREYTERIFERPWPGYVKQKRFGLEQCTGEWVLNLDADEEVSPELKQEVLTMLENDKGEVDGYMISRVVFHLGKWWRKGGWYPEYRLRLCRREKTSWGGEDPHEKAIVNGGVRKLKGELLHYTYSDLSHQVRTLNNYSQQGAESMWRRGRRAGGVSIFLRPVARFFKFYLLRKGYREGFPGLLVAFLEAYYDFLKYAKLWEIERKSREAKQE